MREPAFNDYVLVQLCHVKFDRNIEMIKYRSKGLVQSQDIRCLVSTKRISSDHYSTFQADLHDAVAAQPIKSDLRSPQ